MYLNSIYNGIKIVLDFKLQSNLRHYNLKDRDFEISFIYFPYK